MASLRTTSSSYATLINWLDGCYRDFEECQRRFSTNRNVPGLMWRFFSDRDQCFHFLTQNTLEKSIILVTNGRLIAEIIDNVNALPQIRSIYVYCNKIERYQPWLKTHDKVREIFDDPIQLCNRLGEQFDEDLRRMQPPIHNPTDSASLEEIPIAPIPCFFKNEIKSFYQANLLWRPWLDHSWVVQLPCRGQGTIEIRQLYPVPFNLTLSNKANLNDGTTSETYGIVFKVNSEELRLSTIDSRDGHDSRVRKQTNRSYQILQPYNGHWHRYWISFYNKKRIVRVGMGEVRPRFQIFELQLEEYEKNILDSINYVHLSAKREIKETAVDKLKIFIGKEPVLFDPPVFIISPVDFSSTQSIIYNGVSASLLENPCRDLYGEVKKFTLNDVHFPNLIETIERSLFNESGWCYRKLREKQRQFAQSRLQTLSLRISLTSTEDRIFKYRCLLEIWPSGYYGPVREQYNTYGILRVLHGNLLVKFHPNLTANPHEDVLLEQLFTENQVTWIMPNLNQVHQISYPDTHDSCCIAIQCYADVSEENQSSLLMSDDELHGHVEPSTDVDYLTFKRTMREEALGHKSE